MNTIHDNFSNTEIAVYHLIFLGNSITNTIKAFTNSIGKMDDMDEMALWVSTTSMTLIQTISFLDEYDNFVLSDDEELNNTINAIKKSVKPAIKQIREWKELREFRNEAIAHNLRDKNKMISVFERGLSSYDIPQSGADMAVLYNCVLMVKQTFESAFGKILIKIQQFLDQHKEPAKERRFKSGEEANAAIARITEEINKNILELKILAGVLKLD